MPKSPENIHRFNVTALAVLERLYNSFPDPVRLNAEHIGIDAAPNESTAQDYWNYGAGADNVVTWLAEESFLRYVSKGSDGDFYGVRLTLKGLTVLGYIPVSIVEGGKKSTAIERIKRTLASGTEKAGEEAVKSIIGALFKMSLRYGLSESISGGISA